MRGRLWVFFCAGNAQGEKTQQDSGNSKQPGLLSSLTFLVTQYRRGIGIFAEGLLVSSGEDFHHPAMEVIHRVVLDRAKAAVVFFACFVEVTPQPIANVFVLTTQLDVLGPQ